MSTFGASEYSNAIERLSKNLVSANAEVRERAAESLVMKLELQIVPYDILISEYHFLIGQCLVSLNQTMEKPAPATVSNLIKILQIFTKSDNGKSLLKKYGTVEFMSEFLKYNKSAGNEIAVDAIEALLFALVNKNVVALLGTKTVAVPIQQTQQLQEPVSLIAQTEKTNKIIIGGIGSIKTLAEKLNNNIKIDCLFGSGKQLKISDEDRTFLIEQTTFMKFLKQQDLTMNSNVYQGLIKMLANFPVETFTGGFSDTLLELFKLLLNTKSKLIFATLYANLLSWIEKDFTVQKNFTPKMMKIGKAEQLPEQIMLNCETYLQDSYPKLFPPEADKTDKNESKKLTFSNILEIVLRLFVNVIQAQEYSIYLTGRLKRLLVMLFQYSADETFQNCLNILLLNVVEFWECFVSNAQKSSNDHLQNFQFMKSYSGLVLWLFESTIERMSGKSAIHTSGFVEGLKNVFDFSKFTEWFVQGLFKPTKVQRILHLLQSIDSTIASNFLRVTEMKSSRELLLTTYAQPNIDWSLKLENTKIAIESLKEATHALNGLEICDFNIDCFLQLYLICSHWIREFRRANRTIEPPLKDALHTYITEFKHLCEGLLALHSESKTTHYLRSSFENILKTKPKTVVKTRPNFDSEQELRIVFRESSWLTTLIVSSLESIKLHENQLISQSTVDIITVFMSEESKLPTSTDPFLLALFLQISADKSQSAKGLQNWLTVRYPIINKATQLLSIFSKDYLLSFNALNSFVFDLKDDHSFTLETAKKMQLLGATSEPKINPKHHYFDIVDTASNQIIYKPNSKLLARLANESTFVDSARMQEVHDILELYTNKKLETKIRVEALNQSIEAMMSLRKNREARGFSVCLINIVTQALLEAEDGSMFTEAYLRALVSFLCYQKYHEQMKVQLIQKLRDWVVKNEFKPLEKIFLSAVKSGAVEFRFNALAFAQVLFFSTALWNWERKGNMPESGMHAVSKSDLKVQSEELLEDVPDKKVKIGFWTFAADRYYNFFGGKDSCLAEAGSDHTAPVQIVKMIKREGGNFFQLFDRLQAHIESELSQLKKMSYSINSCFDLYFCCEKTIGLTLTYSKYKSLIDSVSDSSKVANSLNSVSETLTTKLNGIADAQVGILELTEFFVCAMFTHLPGKEKGLKTTIYETFSELLIRKLNNPQNNQQTILNLLQICCNCLRINPEFGKSTSSTVRFEGQFISNICQTFRTADTPLAVKLCTVLPECQIQQQSSEILSLLSKSLTNFRQLNSFSDVSFKLDVFQLFLTVLRSQNQSNYSYMFEFYLRAKDATRSSVLMIRLRGWLSLLHILQKTNDFQLVQETFYRCKEQIEHNSHIESPKINILVLAVLVELFKKQGGKELQTDFMFLKTIVTKMNTKSILELNAELNLVLQMSKLIWLKDNQILKESTSKLIDFVFEKQIHFVRISLSANAPQTDLSKSSRQQLNNEWKSQHKWESINSEENDLSSAQKNCLNFLPTILLQQHMITDREVTPLIQTRSPHGSKTANSALSGICQATKLYLLLLDQTISILCSTPKEKLSTYASKIVKIQAYLNFIYQHSVITESYYSDLGFNLMNKLTRLVHPSHMTLEEIQWSVTSCLQFLQLTSNTTNKHTNDLKDYICRLIIYRCQNQKTQIAPPSLSHQIQILTALILNTKDSNFNSLSFQNLIYLLSVSNHAKHTFLTSNFIESRKHNISKLIAEKDITGIKQYYQLFLSLFYPVNDKINTSEISFYPKTDILQTTASNTESQTHTDIKANLRGIFFILSKSFVIPWENDDQTVQKLTYDIFINWHLNDQLCLFIEKQALKGKHFVLNLVIDSVKDSSRMTSPTFLTSLEFLKVISSREFVGQQLCKTKSFSAVTSHVFNLHNSNKKGQVLTSNIRAIKVIVELLHAYSFHRFTHPKMFENKASFDAFWFFLEAILKGFKKRTVESLEDTLEKPLATGNGRTLSELNSGQEQENVGTRLEFSTIVFKILVLLSNLLTTTTTKAYVTETAGFVDLILDCLSYTSRLEDQLLISQILYNLVYKDGSAVKLLQNERFEVTFNDLLQETKTFTRKADRVVLASLNTSSKDQSTVQRETLLKNLLSIQEIVTFQSNN